MRRLALSLVPVLFLLTARNAAAWANKAHRIVGLLAERHLTAEARTQIKILLAGEANTDLAAVSTWADEIRINPAFRFSGNGHFVDIPLSATGGDLTQYCPDDDCITATLNTVGKAVADRSLDSAKRAAALKFLVHLVADVHQPLHCADNNDAGGNRVRVLYGGRATTLHAAWDSGLVETIPGSEDELATQIDASITPTQRTAWNTGDPTAWAWESFGIAKAVAYTSALRTPAAESFSLGPDYVDAAHSAILQQLAKAGVRLAAQLNGRLRPEGPRNISTWLYPEQRTDTVQAPASTERPAAASGPLDSNQANTPAKKAGREPNQTEPVPSPKPAPHEDTFTTSARAILGAATLLAAALTLWYIRKRGRRRVFVCYRRKTTQADAGRIFDRLASSFGRNNVFRDLDSIAPGMDFVDVIDDRVTTCDAVVAVIGPDWSRDSRLHLPNDYVRRELAHALRVGIPVIPVLVQNASMPAVSDLPDDLQRLCRRSAITIADHLFTESVQALAKGIRDLPPRRSPTASERTKRQGTA